MAAATIEVDPKDLASQTVDPKDLGARPDVGALEDSARSIVPGIATGVAGTLKPFQRLGGMSYLNTVLGLKPDATDEKFLNDHPIAGPLIRGMVTAGIAPMAAAFPALFDAAKSVPFAESVGDSYEPTTIPGKITKTAASFAVNALGPGKGSLLRTLMSAAGRVMFPTLASEIPGELTEGTPAEPYVRGVGAVVGSMGHGLAEGAPALKAAATASPAAQKAAEAIEKAAGGPIEIDNREIIPGSRPTLNEAAADANPGLAGLQRTIRDDPKSGLAQREADNHQARKDFLAQLAGNEGDVESAKLARDTVTKPMRDDAFALAKANGAEADASSARSVISRILQSPEGKRTVVEREMNDLIDKLELENPLKDRVGDAVAPIKDELSKSGVGADRRADLTAARRLLNSASRGFISEDDLVSGLKDLAKKQKIVGPIDNALKVVQSGDTKLESDPEQLYGVVKHINDRLSKLASSNDRDAQLAASQLTRVKDALDGAIEKAAPGYADYKSTYQSLSNPIDRMTYLQTARLQDANGNPTLAKVASFNRNVREARAFKGGIHPAKSLSDDDIAGLQNLEEDLRGQGRITMGKSIGSDSVQKLAGYRGLQDVLPEKSLPLVGRYVRPEFAGGALGYALGGEYGAAAGAMGGRVLEAAQEGKRAAVEREIHNQLLNPEEYQRASQAAKATTNVRGWWPETMLRAQTNMQIGRERGLIGQ